MSQLLAQVDYNLYNDSLGLSGGKVNTSSLGSIIGSLLPYILVFAGIILFGMLIAGGFTMLAGATDKHAQEKGKGMLTSAGIGFAVIFLAYWIAQILQVIFKVNIVS